jgi:hypothetical protein
METINITSYFSASYSPSFIVWDGNLLWGHGDNFSEAVLSALDCYSEQRECNVWEALERMKECAVYDREGAEWHCIGALNDVVLDVLTWVGYDLDGIDNTGDPWPGVRERVVIADVTGRGCPTSKDKAVEAVKALLAEGCIAGGADGIAEVECSDVTWKIRHYL